jgi:hypothetical protein
MRPCAIVGACSMSIQHSKATVVASACSKYSGRQFIRQLRITSRNRSLVLTQANVVDSLPAFTAQVRQSRSR